METLVQLVEAYERKHHAIDISDISGMDTLRFLLDESGMNASDLARLLGVHASLGSKILNGDRALTLKHVRKPNHNNKLPGILLARMAGLAFIVFAKALVQVFRDAGVVVLRRFNALDDVHIEHSQFPAFARGCLSFVSPVLAGLPAVARGGL